MKRGEGFDKGGIKDSPIEGILYRQGIKCPDASRGDRIVQRLCEQVIERVGPRSMFAQVHQMIDGRILVTWFYHVDHELVEHHSVEVFEPGVDSRNRLLRVFFVERKFSCKLFNSNKIIFFFFLMQTFAQEVTYFRTSLNLCPG
jgi:hypothetical protein